MRTSKFEEQHTRENEGAGYDISASRSDAQSQAANQQAGTVINFGSGANLDAFSGASQSAVPNATSTAARNAGDTSGKGAIVDSNGRELNWPMIGVVAIGSIALVAAIYYATKKGE